MTKNLHLKIRNLKKGFTLMKQTSVRSQGFTLMNKNSEGFTLIELLVVISIIGVLIAVSIFGLQGAREASRDSRRKSDLEQIRSGIEIYKADCNTYPGGNGEATAAIVTSGTSLMGDGTSSASCDADNTYIQVVPSDPSASLFYRYYSDGTTYQLCASLEQPSEPGNVSCGSSSDCGESDCNYKVVNP